MKLSIEDITNKHKDQPCVVACHGPSLNNDKDKISSLQKEGKVIRFSVNEWYDFFDFKPDYWIVSNTEFTIGASISGSPLWRQRKYPHDVFNKYGVPLFYNSSVDLTPLEFVENNLKCDYIGYDYKHFKGHTCEEIILNFKKHYEENRDLNFKFYGNSSHMWQRPDITNVNPYCAGVHNKIGGAYFSKGKCCKHIEEGTITIQEELQRLSGHEQHLGPVATVAYICVIFAILMGCNPIYISGLDLDYSLGYAKNKSNWESHINIGNIGHWKHSYRQSLLEDMRILKESANNLGIKIVNLNKESWHNVFEKGDLLVNKSL